MRRTLNQIVGALVQHGYPARDQFKVRLALEDAVVNALKHAHRGDRTKVVRLRYHINAKRIIAEVSDQGPGFDPQTVADPCCPENVDRPGGRGVFLMRTFMTRVRYNRQGNCVTLYKRRSAE
jgi:serine/threonine-protein kinase RsbW